jgi:hypothetical protein
MALRHDRGHDLVGVVNALAALEAQSQRERVGEIAGFGPSLCFATVMDVTAFRRRACL